MDDSGPGNNCRMAVVGNVRDRVIRMVVGWIISITIWTIIESMRVPQVCPKHNLCGHPSPRVAYARAIESRLADDNDIGRIIPPLNFNCGYFLIRPRTIHHRQRKSAHAAFSIFSDMDIINIAGPIEVKIIDRPGCVQFLFYLRRVLALFYDLRDGL